MSSCYPSDAVLWIQWLIHQVLFFEDPTECLLYEVKVVIEGAQEPLSDRMAEPLFCGNLLQRL